jgi:hypothetical protein
MANTKRKATGEITAEDLEKARIVGALDMFFAIFKREECGKLMNSREVLEEIADEVNVPAAAIVLEVGRCFNDSIDIRGRDLAAIDRDPLIKSIVLERDGAVGGA